MPTFNGQQLFDIAARVITGMGVADGDAAMIAGELRDANLVGHDSHGVMRLMQYATAVEAGPRPIRRDHFGRL